MEDDDCFAEPGLAWELLGYSRVKDEPEEDSRTFENYSFLVLKKNIFYVVRTVMAEAVPGSPAESNKTIVPPTPTSPAGSMKTILEECLVIFFQHLLFVSQCIATLHISDFQIMSPGTSTSSKAD